MGEKESKVRYIGLGIDYIEYFIHHGIKYINTDFKYYKSSL
jgi:predicted aldo/keto reductase-like oxidoreductase